MRTAPAIEPRADVAHLAPSFGVYIHIPYCVSRCPYCDFNTYVGIEDTAPEYVDALLREASTWRRRQAGSIFLGGGTPSLLDPPLMRRLLDGVREQFDVTPDAEITMEANPETVDVHRLEAFRAAGINRISFGAQSFAPHVLKALGRAHTAERTRMAVAEARAAEFENLSLDLIYGTPGETAHDWRRSLDEAISLEPEHLSAYSLTIEEGTAFGVAVSSGTMPAPDEDDQAAKYETALDVLADAGYEHYEISNWARPGRASRHNLVYWTQGDYAGLGAGAHSHETGERWWNIKLPRAYIDRSPDTRADGEQLDRSTRSNERIQLLLRLIGGTPLDELRPDPSTLHSLAEDGLVWVRDGRIILTRRGLLLQSEVAARLTSV
jgi:oxygen-independent coproporphyrinogen-3 oxidase